MNEYGKIRAEELSAAQYTALEYRKKLTRIQNMSMLCHRSAEIDYGTLLYYSVNDMFLGDKDFYILLFSEISPPNEEQMEGRDVYSQLFTYGIVEEVVHECFSGHYTYYASELDGRLVVIVCFLYGVLPGESDIHFLFPTCEEIAKICSERYGLNVIAYISDAVKSIHSVSIIYHKLLNRATLHRYIEQKFDSPIVLVSPPPMSEYPPALPYSESAKSLANALLSNENFHGIADEMLKMIISMNANSTEDLKVRLGEYLDKVYTELQLRGVKLKLERLRAEQFEIFEDAKHWSESTRWFHQVLDSIAKDRQNQQQQILRQKLESAQRYIDDHIADPNLSAEEVGKAVDMNASFLSTAFKRQLQITPTSYIRKKRLENALSLLKQSKLKIDQISDLCGFGSVETFHRVFKTEFGATPAKIRRELNK